MQRTPTTTGTSSVPANRWPVSARQRVKIGARCFTLLVALFGHQLSIAAVGDNVDSIDTELAARGFVAAYLYPESSTRPFDLLIQSLSNPSSAALMIADKASIALNIDQSDQIESRIEEIAHGVINNHTKELVLPSDLSDVSGWSAYERMLLAAVTMKTDFIPAWQALAMSENGEMRKWALQSLQRLDGNNAATWLLHCNHLILNDDETSRSYRVPLLRLLDCRRSVLSDSLSPFSSYAILEAAELECRLAMASGVSKAHQTAMFQIADYRRFSTYYDQWYRLTDRILKKLHADIIASLELGDVQSSRSMILDSALVCRTLLLSDRPGLIDGEWGSLGLRRTTLLIAENEGSPALREDGFSKAFMKCTEPVIEIFDNCYQSDNSSESGDRNEQTIYRSESIFYRELCALRPEVASSLSVLQSRFRIEEE
ncbi:MAG: hypothetical protein KDA91_16680 [Planctomycetaceae bacterium]|nr:hypothetical protein [Planctomycetaceae bacterium]